MILFTYYLLYNLPLWISLNFFNIVLKLISIKLTVLSSDPVARYYPSGENATLYTKSNNKCILVWKGSVEFVKKYG